MVERFKLQPPDDLRKFNSTESTREREKKQERKKSMKQFNNTCKTNGRIIKIRNCHRHMNCRSTQHAHTQLFLHKTVKVYKERRQNRTISQTNNEAH